MFLKTLLRKYFLPIITNKGFIFDFCVIIYYNLGFFFYLYSKIFSKIYIGSYLFSDQEAGRERQKEILKIVSKIKNKNIDILEIGVFCGQTTINIIKSLKDKRISYNYYCVDIWKEYEVSKILHDKRYQYFLRDLKSGNAFNLFKHNIRVLKKNKFTVNGNILIRKMLSSTFFKKNNKKFDLIILDASHLFKHISQDIYYSKKNIKNMGYIIGDDYEMESSKIKEKDLIKLKNFDVWFSKKYNFFFHPGVTLSVKKHFKNLKSNKGLFCVQYSGRKFIDQFKSIN